MATNLINRLRPLIPYLLFFGFASLFGLSRSWEGMLDGDSLWFTIVAKNILANKDWIILTYRGNPWLDHPPLCFWILALLFKLFGVNIYVAKLMNVLFFGGVLSILYLFGRRLKDERAGILAALIFAFTPQVITYIGRVRLDYPLIFFITLAVFAFYLGITKSRRYFWLYAFATTGALLSKGAPGIAPILISCGTLLLLKKWRDLFSFQFIGANFLILFLIFTWILLIIQNGGGGLLTSHLKYQIFSSVFHARGGTEYPSFWYLLGIIFTRGAPWSWLALIGGGLIARSWINNRKLDERVLLVLWAIVIYLGFSIPKFKFSYYILPIYVPLALLAAPLLVRFFTFQKLIRVATGGLIGISIIIAVFPIPIRKTRGQEITPILPVIQSHLKQYNIRELLVTDIDPILENNIYQLLAVSVDPGIRVRNMSREEFIDPVPQIRVSLMPISTWDFLKREDKRLSLLALSSSLALVTNQEVSE